MGSLRDLLREAGPALAPEVAVAIARGLLAEVDDGPWDDVAPRPDAENVKISHVGGALAVRHEGRIDLPGVGALLYEMLAGGPVRRAKDPPGTPPRPLAKLREFMAGGPPLSESLVGFVERLLGTAETGVFASADAAMDALEALGQLEVPPPAGRG